MADLFNNTGFNPITPPSNPFTSNDDKQKEKKRVINSDESKSTFNSDNPNSPDQFNFQDFLKQREAQIRAQEQQRATQQIYTEKLIFNRKNQETQAAIESIKKEIKTLIKMTKGVSATLFEAEKSVSSQTIDASNGDYYLSFFQRIKRLIRLTQKRLAQSQNWLEIFNQRSKAKSYYWAQAKKSGGKFTQSHERSVVMQTD